MQPIPTRTLLAAWLRRAFSARRLGLLLPAAALLAQEPAISPSPDTKTVAEVRVFGSAREAVATVTERGAHHRVEQWVERIIGEDGTTNDVTHSYTVLANGMNYLDGGEWKETVAEFVPVQGGWLAGRGPHQVFVSDDLFVAGAVTVVSSEGATWKSTPMTLALRDRAKGEVLVLGESRATRGEQAAANMILFRDAFDGPVPADVRVIYTAAGVECDVILRSRLPLSATLGADPAQCDLVVQTEVFEGGPTALRERQLTVNKPADGQPDATQKVPEFRADAVLELGALRMEDGKAFGIDADPAKEPGQSVPVFKRYYQDEATQRLFLEESTPLDSLGSLLEPLPEAGRPGAWEARWRDTALNETGARKSGVAGTLRPAPALPRRDDGRFEVATLRQPWTFDLALSADPGLPVTPHPSLSSPGLVLDWSYLNSAGAFTLTAGSTYSITGAVTLGGSGLVVTAEPGVVVKYAPGGTASLNIASGTDLRWLAEPYRPVILTARDDNTVGETVANSTGVISGIYANQALVLNGSGRTTDLVLANLHVRHANYGVDAVYFGQTGQLKIRHGQFVNCTYPFKFQLGWTTGYSYHLQNVLVSAGNTLFKDLYYARILADFVTAANVTTFRQSQYNPDNSTVMPSNSVFVGVAGIASDLDQGVLVANPAAGLFAQAGAGSHYIAATSPLSWYATNGGIPEDWSAGPGQAYELTLTPPEILGNVNVPTTLARLSNPNADNRRVGYHYWRLDQLAENVALSSSLTLSKRVVVGVTGTQAFQLNAGSSFNSTGAATAPNRLVRASLVQEGNTGLTGATFNLFAVGTGAPRPTIDATFTVFSLPPDPLNRRTWMNLASDRVASLNLTHCQLENAVITLSPSASSESQAMVFRNNRFQDCRLYFYRYYDHNMAVTFMNNLVRGGDCWASYYQQATQNPYWYVRDNLFESVNLLSTSAYVVGSNNGYTASTAAFGGSGNLTALITTDPTTGWQTGPLGRLYYPAKATSGNGLGRLVDAAYQTVAASGLNHYTTQVSQTKEGLEPVPLLDIGFHQPTDPPDTDGDGLNDAWEMLHWGNLAATGTGDSDSDTISNQEEQSLGLNPLADDRLVDDDGDGLSNYQEWRVGMPIQQLDLAEKPGPSSRFTPLAITEIMHRPTAGQAQYLELACYDLIAHSLEGCRLQVKAAEDATFANLFSWNATDSLGAYGTANDRLVIEQSAFLTPYASSGLPPVGTLELVRQLAGGPTVVLLRVDYGDPETWPPAAVYAGHSAVLSHPSYGEGDRRAWRASDRFRGSKGKAEEWSPDKRRRVVINEVSARPNGQAGTEFVELYNTTGEPLDIGGCFLGAFAPAAPNPTAYQIPVGTILPARSAQTFTLTIPDDGSVVTFSASQNPTTLLRVLDVVRVPKLPSGQSWGRYPSGGNAWSELAASSPGTHSGQTRKISAVVINEIMHSSIRGEREDEFIELFNPGATALTLNGWKLRSDSWGDANAFTFPAGTTISAGGYLIVANDSAQFQENYPNHASIPKVYLNNPQVQRLPGGGLQLEILNAAGELVARVHYNRDGDWGVHANGGGSSLELADYRLDPQNRESWRDSDETAKAGWVTVSATDVLGSVSSNQRLAPTHARVDLTLADRGEWLVDGISAAVQPPNAAELAVNGELSSNASGWSFRGNHDQSLWQATGGGGSTPGCLRLIAVGRGDYGDNRVRNHFSSAIPLADSDRVSLSAKVKWQAGTPYGSLRLHNAGAELVINLFSNRTETLNNQGVLEVTYVDAIPKNLGTPGSKNSRILAELPHLSLGPQIRNVRHYPLLPQAGKPVLVLAELSDPDGVKTGATGETRLYWRADRSTSRASVLLLDDGVGDDAVPGDGVFTATVPAASVTAGTILSLQLSAQDNLTPGQIGLFPDSGLRSPQPGPDLTSNTRREIALNVGDATVVPPSGASGYIPVYRVWCNQDTVKHWANRVSQAYRDDGATEAGVPAYAANSQHNTPLQATVVLNDSRVIYDAGAQYGGSPYTGGLYAPTQATVPKRPTDKLFHCVLSFPSTEPLLGTDEANLEFPTFDFTGQVEQLGFWIAQRSGLPAVQRRFVHLHFNGQSQVNVPNPFQGANLFSDQDEMGRAGFIYEDTQRPDRSILRRWYGDAEDDQMVKFSRTISPEPNLQPKLRRIERGAVSTDEATTKNAAYRWRFEKRDSTPTDHRAIVTALLAGSDINRDYASASGTTTKNATASARLARWNRQVEVRQWMRTLAVPRVVIGEDNYGWVTGQNMYGYLVSGGRWTLMLWDLDNAGRSEAGRLLNPSFGGNRWDTDLFDNVFPSVYGGDDGDLAQIRAATPAGRRAFLQGIESVMATGFNESAVRARLNAIHSALKGHGILTAADDTYLGEILNRLVGTIAPPGAQTRWSYLAGQLVTANRVTTVPPEDVSPVAFTASLTVNTTTRNLELSGSAPLRVGSVDITLNGSLLADVPLVWHYRSSANNNPTSWSLKLRTWNDTASQDYTVVLTPRDHWGQPLNVPGVQPLTVTDTMPVGTRNHTGLRVTEFMPQNLVVKDPWGNTSDWIELGNETLDTILPLSDYSLRDNTASQFTFPENTWLTPQRTVVVWANDASSSIPPYRAPFQLGGGGDQVNLSAKGGTLLANYTWSSNGSENGTRSAVTSGPVSGTSGTISHWARRVSLDDPLPGEQLLDQAP